MLQTADWSGYVPPPNCRKYISQKESNIACGVGGDENSNWKPKLKIFNDKHVDSTENFGGPVPEDNPSIVGSIAWQSEAQSAATSKTTISQLTEGGRSMFVRGKQSTIPAYELLARPYSESVGARLRQENPYNLHDSNDVSGSEANKFGQAKGNDEDEVDKYSLVGYRAGITSKSFLDGLGAEVARAKLGMTKTDDK